MRASALLLTALALLGGSASLADDAGPEFFESKIRPVLVEKCNRCHSAGPKAPKGGLRLDSPEGIRAGGDTGPVMVPGKSEESPIIEAIEHGGGVAEMPPDSKLPEKAIADFRTWVEMGSPMPVAVPGAAKGTSKGIDLEAGRRFWSLLPVSLKATPIVSDPSWPRTRVDRFILRTLDDKGMKHAPEADRRTLIRRASLDLIGLPPTFEESEAFAADNAPGAYERLVDRLLASPRHGERWARHWLDVARYAEDNPTGEATNKPPRNPHVYRDWVIKALNADLPYDEFVRRQLAADLVPGLPPAELAATGFLGLSPVYHKEAKLSAEVISTIVCDEWDERLDTVTRGFLGLTVACARCHDHKFDPIPTSDYYALAGVMAGTQLVERPLSETDPATTEALASDRAAQVDLEQRLGYTREMKGTAAKAGGDKAKFDPIIADLDRKLKQIKAKARYEGPTAPAVRDAALWVDGGDGSWTSMDYRIGASRDLPVLIRGSLASPGPIAPRRFLTALSPADPRPFGPGSGRLDLAEAIVGQGGALAARVIVNRAWGWHFGRGLVTTPSNFGKLGDAPSHPELLDDLAARFIASGWSLRWLHREIVLSSTYRQSSRSDAGALAADPENRWLARAARTRLDVEAWRDALLAVSGSIELTMGGPSGNLEGPDFCRRTVYGKIGRGRVADILRSFDFPDANRHGESRDTTTTPLQQLYFLNSPFLLARAAELAKRGADAPPADRVRSLYRAALLRDPTEDEVHRAVSLAGSDPARGWSMLAQALLIGNEFLFVD